MANNPNPARISGPEWQLWERAKEIITGVRLGGIFASKSGYHNTVDANRSRWPGNYSIRFALDTQHGPSDKARAIDLTMSDVQMRAYTRRLANAAAAEDPRMRPVREFYGTVDSQVVTGRIRDSDGGAYRSSTSDSSHLWHIHVSFWAAYCADWTALSGVADILAGIEEDDMPSAEEIAKAVWSRTNPTLDLTYGTIVRYILNGTRPEHAQDGNRLGVVAGLDATRDAILAAVSGEDVVTAVRAELEQHRELAAQQRQAEHAELAELVRQGQAGEVAADEVVRLIGERLTAVGESGES